MTFIWPGHIWRTPWLKPDWRGLSTQTPCTSRSTRADIVWGQFGPKVPNFRRFGSIRDISMFLICLFVCLTFLSFQIAQAEWIKTTNAWNVSTHPSTWSIRPSYSMILFSCCMVSRLAIVRWQPIGQGLAGSPSQTGPPLASASRVLKSETLQDYTVCF